MNNKSKQDNNQKIHTSEYASILTATACLVVAVITIIFAGGALALTRLFHLPWYFGIVLFIAFMLAWTRKPKAK